MNKSKIFESPDKGRTIYERELGSHPSTRKLIYDANSKKEKWNITFKGMKVEYCESLISR